MANLNINKLQSPYLREFFNDVFDGTTGLEGISVQAEGVSIPIAFTAVTPVNAVASVGTLTFSSTVSDGETVTIGTDVYEFDTNASVTAGNILVDVSGGATASAAVTALAAAILASGDGTYTGTDGAGDTIVVTAVTKGVVGDTIATTETCANAAFDAVTLGTTTAGVDGTVGAKGQMFADASYLYFAIAANTTADRNWRRVTLGSAY